jgi:HSP20 family protein
MNSKGLARHHAGRTTALQHHDTRKLAHRDTGRVPVMRKQGLAQVIPFQREMDRYFDKLAENFGLRPMWQWTEPLAKFDFAPQLDIEETPEKFMITTELPGMERADIEITVAGQNLLRIRGEKKEESEDKSKGNHWTKRAYDSFERTISLSTPVDANKVEAHMKNGVLSITLPKTGSERTQEHKITVKAA